MLEETRRLTMAPGSNVGQVVDTSWLHLLPDLDLGTVIFVGPVPDPVRNAVAVLADRVDERGTVTAGIGGSGASLVVAAAGPDGGLDRVVADLERIVAADVPIAVVPPFPDDALPDTLNRRWFAVAGRKQQSRAWRRGERALLLAAGRIAHRLGRVGPAAQRHASDVDLQRPIAISDGGRRVHRRWTALLSTSPALNHPPAYLRELARVNGFELSQQWSFAPARGFRSQKVIFVVEAQDADVPMVLKATQDPRFNHRLAAEVRALQDLAGVEAEPLCLPSVRFHATRGGLLHVAETWLGGRPLRQVVEPAPGAGLVRSVGAGLARLAAATASPAGPAEIHEAFGGLLADYEAIYDPPGPVVERLQEAVTRLAAAGIPAVYQHGDFTMWNLVAAESLGPFGVLDWENADPRGIPLWDLFTFVRTFGVFMSDAEGRRYVPRTFRAQLLDASELRTELDRIVAEYCHRLGVSLEAVDDLFLMCWVQQAVREAASWAAPSWQTGSANAYVRATLEHGYGHVSG